MVANRLKNINEYYFSTKLAQIDAMNKAGRKVINLGIGSPDLPPHASVTEELYKAAQQADTHGYQSYRGSVLLRERVANFYAKFYAAEINGITEVLPLMGSKEGIMQICMTYVNEGDLVLVPNPGYPTYTSAATIAGGNCVGFMLKEEDGWMPDYAQIETILQTHRSPMQQQVVMFVNYPNMPTGAQADAADFDTMISFAKANNILLVHDNPYSFILNDTPQSIMSRPDAMEVCVELNSLSKSHNMAGWRIGFLVGKAGRLTEILKFSSNMDSGMFLPAQIAAAKALSLDATWFSELNTVYHRRRQIVYALLDALQCSYNINQVGLFVWAAIPAGWKDGYEICDAVLEQANVFITPGGIFGSAGNHFIRVSLCATEAVFTQALNRIQALNLHKQEA